MFINFFVGEQGELQQLCFHWRHAPLSRLHSIIPHPVTLSQPLTTDRYIRPGLIVCLNVRVTAGLGWALFPIF
jgi:hypothetical protein